MAEGDKSKKKENPKDMDSAREDLDQFTVLQDTEDTHQNELRAREMEADGRSAAPEDGASQGALGKALGEDTALLGVLGELDPAVQEDAVQNPDDVAKTNRNLQSEEFEISDLAPIAEQTVESTISSAGNASDTSNAASLETIAGEQPDTAGEQVFEGTTLENNPGEVISEESRQPGVNEPEGETDTSEPEDDGDDPDDDGVDEDEGGQGNQGDDDPGADPDLEDDNGNQ
ncbi:MAG: hypothetical protein OEY94_10945, partial [Alphaproteobacteria bacterium]|nr:hypothetical protein [Alphaproteobacteria bacterium]